MRGSPLTRFIVLALALAATGLGLMRVTAVRGGALPANPGPALGKTPATTTSVPFRLLPSSAPAAVEIDTGTVLRPAIKGSPITGSVEMDLLNPRIALVVRWKNPPAAGEHRFAKLTLEVPGQETFTHVFDSDGDIDDFVELPLPVKK